MQLESIAPPIPSHGQRNAMQGNYCNTILSSSPNHGQLTLQVGVFVPTLNLLGSQVFTESRSSSLEIQLLLLLHLLLLLLHLLLLLLHLLLLLLASQVFPESEVRLRGYDQV